MLQLEFGCPALSTIGMHAGDLTGNLNLCLARCFPRRPFPPSITFKYRASRTNILTAGLKTGKLKLGTDK